MGEVTKELGAWVQVLMPLLMEYVMLLVKHVVWSKIDCLILTNSVTWQNDETFIVSTSEFDIRPPSESGNICSNLQYSWCPISCDSLECPSLLHWGSSDFTAICCCYSCKPCSVVKDLSNAVLGRFVPCQVCLLYCKCIYFVLLEDMSSRFPLEIIGSGGECVHVFGEQAESIKGFWFLEGVAPIKILRLGL